MDLQQILSNHENANNEQVCTLELKESRSAQCSGLNCKKILTVGTQCVKVDGALAVPYGKEIALKQLFYFCAAKECFNRPPTWSNVRRTGDIHRGRNITQNDLTRFNDSL